MPFRLPSLGILLAVALSGCTDRPPSAVDPNATGLNKLNHIIVIYLENRSFDHLYGEFPGADGFSSASLFPQVDDGGAPYQTLPQPSGSPAPNGLPNAPFNLDKYVSITQPTRDAVHSFYEEQGQIDGGKMDRFVVVSDAQGLVMGEYHTGELPLSREATTYTLCDRFFHAAFGGSFLNHFWAIAAATPVFPNAPDYQVVTISAGRVVKNGTVTPDGYVINNLESVNTPHSASGDPASRVPSQTMPTIGDRLTEKGLNWAWFSEGWETAKLGAPPNGFAFHHQPFAYFANYADGTVGRAQHLRSLHEFDLAARAGLLPAVSFVQPLDTHSEHPGNSLLAGEQEILRIINEVRDGPQWEDAAIIITYDENGGFWDHVAPPAGDRWGPGTRVPTIVISPYAKKGFVDHTIYDTTSILALIEHRWGLSPLSSRDAAANDMQNSFDFTQLPGN
ncbi:MAG: phospholipase C [Gemmatimonadaceae bacterium]